MFLQAKQYSHIFHFFYVGISPILVIESNYRKRFIFGMLLNRKFINSINNRADIQSLSHIYNNLVHLSVHWCIHNNNDTRNVVVWYTYTYILLFKFFDPISQKTFISRFDLFLHVDNRRHTSVFTLERWINISASYNIHGEMCCAFQLLSI